MNTKRPEDSLGSRPVGLNTERPIDPTGQRPAADPMSIGPCCTVNKDGSGKLEWANLEQLERLGPDVLARLADSIREGLKR